MALVGTAVPLTGCDLFDDKSEPPDPLEPLAAEAADLAGRHRAAIAAASTLTDRLTPIADAHQAHADELRRVIGRPAPSGAPATPTVTATEPDGLLAELRQAEQQARENAAKACAAAPAERAALLGSIAAARATHLEALK
ncbi:hypothetical protein ABZ671_16210 [Micromonospora sp. NPDC006766]|uniref:hypothetical protein n=1 Tax=Micromonospora sp. NPDC006766 TaxID=3154778 RepID=UPI0033C8F71B